MSTHQTEEWQSCTQIHYSWYNTEFSSLQDKEPPPRYYQCKENTHILNKGIALQHLLGPHCSKYDNIKPDPICFDQGPGLFSIGGFEIFGEPKSKVKLF